MEMWPHCYRTLTRKGAQPNCLAKGDVGEDRVREKPFPGLLVTRALQLPVLSHMTTSQDL